jgi:hypothetical protein
MKSFADTDIARQSVPARVAFVEALCSRSNRERNFQERLHLAGGDEETLKDPQVRGLIHYYLSYYQNNGKFQLLFNYMLTQWNVSKLFLEEWVEADVESITKKVTMMDKMTDLSSKLNEKIEVLFSEIYGDDEVIGIAKDQIVQTAMSPERRLRKKKVVIEADGPLLGD